MFRSFQKIFVSEKKNEPAINEDYHCKLEEPLFSRTTRRKEKKSWSPHHEEALLFLVIGGKTSLLVPYIAKKRSDLFSTYTLRSENYWHKKHTIKEDDEQKRKRKNPNSQIKVMQSITNTEQRTNSHSLGYTTTVVEWRNKLILQQKGNPRSRFWVLTSIKIVGDFGRKREDFFVC